MAAYREGMKLVLIPKDNESDLYDVDDEVKQHIQFVPVSTLEQVLDIALLKAAKPLPARRTRARKPKTPDAILPPPADKTPQPGVVC